MKLRLLLCLIVLFFAIATANAQNNLAYTVSGTFSDGGTFSGSFDYDSVANKYSKVSIVTTAGTVRTSGATYTVVCGQDVPTCVGVSQNATGYLNLTTTDADQTGKPGMSLFFGSALTNFGEGDFGVGQGTPTNDLFSLEANCGNANCASPAGPSRSTSTGTLSSSPTLFMFMFFN